MAGTERPAAGAEAPRCPLGRPAFAWLQVRHPTAPHDEAEHPQPPRRLGVALTPAWPTPEQGAPEQSLAHAVPNQTSVLDVCFRPDRNAKQDPNTDTRRGGDSCRPVSRRGSASPRSCLGTRGASTVGGEPQEGAACGQVRGVLAHTLAGAAVAGAGGAQPGRGEGGFHSEANANEASRILSLDDCPAVGWPGGRDRACARCVRAGDVAPRSHAGPAALQPLQHLPPPPPWVLRLFCRCPGT